MFLRQFYDDVLAQASYMIACQAVGEAIVIDPLRDVDAYVAVAAREGLRIVAVTETHIHADFVSGARELAARTGATIYLSGEGGPDWQYGYATSAADGERVQLVRDGDRITVGNVHLDVWHTPGHTPEHLAFLVTDTPRAAGAMGIVSGDFVFVGDVGRPDLLERAAGVRGSMDGSARQLFASIKRFCQLPDHLQVLPGHGAGSACGKALGAIPSSTVGYEKLSNWALADLSEDEFVHAVLDGQPEAPRHFARMKYINRDGPTVLGARPPIEELPTDALERLAADEHTWLVDLRPTHAFTAAHIPRSVSLPFGRSFATWAGTVLPPDADIVLLADEGYPREAVRALSLIGIDRVSGWMNATDAASAWRAADRALAALPEYDIRMLAQKPGTAKSSATEVMPIVDVRDEREWNAGHLPDALHITLGHLASGDTPLPERAFAVHCQSGSRSVIATSLLHRLGRTDVVNLAGGYAAWAAAGLPVTR